MFKNNIDFKLYNDFFELLEDSLLYQEDIPAKSGNSVALADSSVFIHTINEQLKQTDTKPPISICPSPVGFFIDEKNGRHLASCKRWECPVCGNRKKMALMNRIGRATLEAMQRGGYRWRMWTLTQATDDDTNIMHAWNRLRASLLRCGFKNLEFILVKEFTQKGKRHLHIAVNAYIPQKQLSKLWLRATNGKSPVTWVTGRKIQTAAGYMFKYISKDVQGGTQFKKGEHRYSMSRKKGGLNFGAIKYNPTMDYVFYPYLQFGFNQDKLDKLPLNENYKNAFGLKPPPGDGDKNGG